MGLQTKAEACGTALTTEDTAFPQNLLPGGGALQQAVTGDVTGQADGMFDLVVSGKVMRARRAVSCLITPQTADTVALLSTTDGLFITDVLVRPERTDKPLRIDATRDDGKHQDVVLAADNLTLEVEEGLEATGKNLSFRFDAMLMTSRQLALVGKKLLTSMQDIVTNAKTLLASYETSTTRAKNRIDRVSETDQLKAGSLQTQVDTVALTQAETAVFVAKEDIRLDGKRISMG